MEREDTRTRILHSAAEEFLQAGFQGSSLRKIVRNAGVTTGAFYGYFPSKEALFDALVREEYETILSMYREVLTSFQALPPEEQQTDMQNYTAAEVNKMTDYIYDHFLAFKLMVCAAEGTRYACLVDDMATMDVEATHDFAKTMASAGVPTTRVNPTLEHMLTSGMFSAFFELVVHDIRREEADLYISQLLDFYSAGWQKIMGF